MTVVCLSRSDMIDEAMMGNMVMDGWMESSDDGGREFVCRVSCNVSCILRQSLPNSVIGTSSPCDFRAYTTSRWRVGVDVI